MSFNPVVLPNRYPNYAVPNSLGPGNMSYSGYPIAGQSQFQWPQPQYSSYQVVRPVGSTVVYPVYPQVRPTITPNISIENTSNASKWLVLTLGALALSGMAAVTYNNRSQKKALDAPYGPKLVIPKEFQDPQHCDQVAYRIVDEAFPKMMTLLKQYPADSREFWERSPDIYEEAIHRHVALNVRAGFRYGAGEQYQHSGETHRHYKWLDAETGRAYSGLSQDKDKPEQEPVFDIGQMHVFGPDPFRHANEGPLRHRYMQNWYSVFLHETRHLIQGYAEANEPDPPPPIEIARHDPLRKYAKDLSIPYEPAERTLCRKLREAPNQYPHSTDINFDELNEVPQEKLEGYWKDLQEFWLREDFPLFDQKNKALYMEIFTHPDAKRSKLLNYHINQNFIHELESYLTARKRMPGSTKENVAPSDICALACAMYLRDLMRLYYQVNQVPSNEQHPHAQITPLELIE